MPKLKIPSFPHDQSAHEDPALVSMMNDYGSEGYGNWWILQELLSSNPDHKLPRNAAQAEELQKKFKKDAGYVKKFISSLISLKLIQSDGTHIWCDELTRRLKIKANREVDNKTVTFKNMNHAEFLASVAQFSTAYPQAMIEEFTEYWSEPSPSGRMRFQLEDTWDVRLRIKRWSRNNFGKQGIAPVISMPEKRDAGELRNKWRGKLLGGTHQ